MMIARPILDRSSPPSGMRQLAGLEPPAVLVAVAAPADDAAARQLLASAAEDLAAFFPTHSALILHFDPLHQDPLHQDPAAATDASLQAAQSGSPRHVTLPWPGHAHAALKLILQAAQFSRARSCVLALGGGPVAANWLARLATPVVRQEFDLALPHYTRHKYADMVGDNLVYPVLQALYGLHIRQPLGAAWALSAGLVERLAPAYSEVGGEPLDGALWLTATAMTRSAGTVQVGLGLAPHEGKDPAACAVQDFAGPVTTLLAFARRDEALWPLASSVQAMPRRGPANLAASPIVRANVAALRARLLLGAEQYGHIWRQVLAPTSLAQLQTILARRHDIPDFPSWLWARVVYDFLAASRRPGAAAPLLAEALLPLHLGRAAALVMDTASMSNDEAEEMYLLQAETFAEVKPYLVERWQAAAASVLAAGAGYLPPGAAHLGSGLG